MMHLLALLALAALLSACSGDEALPSATASASPAASPSATSAAAVTATAPPAATAEATSTPPLPTPTPAVQGTGVSGVALVGPSCPVQREDEPCPDKPWQGVVVARRASGAEAGRVSTDAAGRFVIQLAPGTYTVVTLTAGVFPAPASVQATVVAGQMTQVELLLDSGIR